MAIYVQKEQEGRRGRRKSHPRLFAFGVNAKTRSEEGGKEVASSASPHSPRKFPKMREGERANGRIK